MRDLTSYSQHFSSKQKKSEKTTDKKAKSKTKLVQNNKDFLNVVNLDNANLNAQKMNEDMSPI